VVDILDTLNAMGYGPVRFLCHDSRDVVFASSFENVEYIVPDDVYSHLDLIRTARELGAIREAAQPGWQLLEGVMRAKMADFAARVRAYASS
jgi:hypothetical protein